MCRCIERDGIKVINMADLVLALRPCVLAGHDVAAQIHGDRVFPVHAAFLAEGLNGSADLQRHDEVPEPFVEPKGLWIGGKTFKQGPP